MKETHNCIYRLVFPNGKCYVGQATNLKRRTRQHLVSAQKHLEDCPKLNNALRAYDYKFEVEILAENIDSVEERNELEKKFISEYDCIENGYNVTIGGESCIDPKTGRSVRYNTGRYKRDENDNYNYNKQRSAEDEEYRLHLNEKSAKWNKEHPEVMRPIQKKWQQNHPEYHKEYNKEHSAEIKEYHSKWRLENREHCNEYAREWRKKKGFKSPSNDGKNKIDLTVMFENVPNKDSFYRMFRRMFGGGRTHCKNFVFPRTEGGTLNEWGNWLHD